MKISRKRTLDKIYAALLLRKQAAFEEVIAGLRRQGRWEVFSTHMILSADSSEEESCIRERDLAHTVFLEGISEGIKHDPAMLQALLTWRDLIDILDR